MTKATVKELARIEQFGTYHLVTVDGDDDDQYQVTVDNAGMVKLPQLVTPAQIPLLVEALQAAEPVAIKQQEDNQSAQVQMNEFFKRQRAATEKLQQRAATQHRKLRAQNKPVAAAPRRSPPPSRKSKVAQTRNTGAVKRQATPPLKPAPSTKTLAKKAAARKAPATTAPAKKAPVKKAPVKKAQKRSG